MSRQENRHNRKRMISRGAIIYEMYATNMSEEEKQRYLLRQSRKHAKTRKPCSCFMGCGNARSHSWGRARLTHDEQLAELSEKEQLEEMINNKEAA